MPPVKDIISIPLTKGFHTIIDASEFERVAPYKWHVMTKYTTAGKPCYYALGHVNGEKVYLHRYLLGLSNDYQVDHVNGDGLDNRIENLRPCTQQENLWNCAKRTSETSSIYKGVCWHIQAKKWSAYITHNRKRIYLGLHEVEADAARAYDTAALALFGEFARPNLAPQPIPAEY